MSIPGAYTSSDREADSDLDFTYSRALADQATVDALAGDGTTEDDSDDDDDFVPADARELWEEDQEDSQEDDSLDEDLEGGEVMIDEDDIEEEEDVAGEGEGEGEDGGDGVLGGNQQIVYHRKFQ